MGNNIYLNVVLELQRQRLKSVEESNDLRWIGFEIDAFRNIIEDGVKARKFNFEESLKCIELLNKFLLIEESVLESLRVSVENLAGDGIGDSTTDL